MLKGTIASFKDSHLSSQCVGFITPEGKGDNIYFCLNEKVSSKPRVSLVTNTFGKPKVGDEVFYELCEGVTPPKIKRWSLEPLQPLEQPK